MRTILTRPDGPTPLPSPKDPADRLLYRMDWEPFLAPLGDAIDTAPGSSVWSVAPAGLTLGPD